MAGLLQQTVSQVLDFLHTLYELGLSHSAIGTHRSAISAIVEIPGVPQLGEHWLVSRFMKGIFHLRPPQPRYTKTWDVNKVLSYLKSLGPNDSLMLKQLTLKTAALLTILGGRRIHTLHMLSVIHMDQSPDRLFSYHWANKMLQTNQTKSTNCLQSICGRRVTLSS